MASYAIHLRAGVLELPQALSALRARHVLDDHAIPSPFPDKPEFDSNLAAAIRARRHQALHELLPFSRGDKRLPPRLDAGGATEGRIQPRSRRQFLQTGRALKAAPSRAAY